MEQWYRYEDVRYAAPVYEDEDYHRGQGRLEVRLRAYPVFKHTPKGVWLLDYAMDKRFVRLEARKRYACPTKHDALVSFIARKQAQQRILQSKLDTVREALVKAKYIQLGETIEAS